MPPSLNLPIWGSDYDLMSSQNSISDYNSPDPILLMEHDLSVSILYVIQRSFVNKINFIFFIEIRQS